MGTSFESLVERAKKRTKGLNRAPFVITVEGDDPIEVEYPDAIKSMNYERAETVYDQLRALLGTDFTRILDLVRGKDISVLQLLITEMWDFWDDDSHEVPGGKEA